MLAQESDRGRARSTTEDPNGRVLNPPDQLHEKLAADCFDQFKEVVRARSSIIEEPYSSIARPFLRMLVFWLMVIFACFGLRAPASPLVLIVIALSAISLHKDAVRQAYARRQRGT